MNDHTGWYSPDEPCGCGLDDPAPCGGDVKDCLPAYVVMCEGSMCRHCEARASETHPVRCEIDAALFPMEADDE